MSEWKTYKLSEIAQMIGGGTPKTTVEEYWNGEIPWLSVVDFGKSIKTVYKTEKTITEKGLKESSTKILKKGQLIISARGTVGELAMLGRDMAFNQSCYGLTATKETTNEFLYYLVKDNVGKIKQNTHGAVFDTITKQTFENIEVTIPESLETQTQIAQILTSLDDKIELNLQMNQTLEAMAQALFKEWFVNFNFPNFDGELENGLPKGWRKEKIGKLFNVTDFVANGSFASLKENVTLLDIEDYAIYVRTTDNNSNFSKGLKYVDLNSFNFLKKSKLFKNEIIISNVGDVGTVFRPPVWLNKPMTLGSNAIMITDNYLNNYICQFLLSDGGQFAISGLISGSAQPKFNKTAFRNLEVIKPSDSIIELFNSFYNSIHHKINTNKNNTNVLTRTQNTLLPKLMSGKFKLL